MELHHQPHTIIVQVIIAQFLSVDFVRELGEPSFDGPGGVLQYNLIELAVTYETVGSVRYLKDDQRPEGVDEHYEGFRYCQWDIQTDLENRVIPQHALEFVELNA